MSDPAKTKDGMADLLALRQGAKRPAPAKRSIPKSENPTSLAPYEPAVAIDLTVDPAEAAQPEPKVQRPAPGSRGSAAAPAPGSDPVRLTVYVDDSHDSFLDDVRAVGRGVRPKLDVSKSAVIRLALERLAADMTAARVCGALADRPIDPKAVGRKRR